MTSNRSTHAAVEKALEILKAFTPENERMGTVELSQKLGLHKSTASRLIKVLEKHEFLEQDRETKKYALGRSAVHIGRAVIQSLSTGLVSIAKPFVDDLRDEVREGVGLEVWAGDTTILAYAAAGPHVVQVSSNLGARMPVHVAAGARAIMAFLPIHVVDGLLEGKLRRFTPRTITDRKVLKRKLREVRSKGVSFERGELDADVHVMAAPIFDHTRRPVAAVAVAAPAFRMKSLTRTDAIAQLKKTAAEVSSRLYYSSEEAEGENNRLQTSRRTA